MAAPQGNQFYKFRKTSGAPIKYDAKFLSDKWNEYLEYCENTIHYKNELIKSGDRAGEIIKVPFQTPLTKSGFCLFAQIPHQTFDTYYSEEMREKDIDLFAISTHIQEAINNYIDGGCLTGALVGSYGARMRGLSDKMDITQQVENVTINIEGKKADLTL